MSQTKSVFAFTLRIAFIACILIGCNSTAKNVAAEQHANETVAAELAKQATIRAVVTDVGAGPLIGTANALPQQMKTQSAAFPKTRAAMQTQMASTLTDTNTPTPVATRSMQGNATPTPIELPAPIPPPASDMITFTVAPTTTQKLGDTVTAAWQAQGIQAVLCPYVMTPTGPVEKTAACADVPLTGTKTLTIEQDALAWDGLLLRVAGAEHSERVLIPLVIGCQGLRDWFMTPAPARCPQDHAVLSSAAFQPFERGFMVWTKNPDRFYVFTNHTPTSGAFEMLDARYSYKPGASPDQRVGETPPPGLFEPVSGFGQIWRGELHGIENVRARLGWATAPESAFDTAYQCEMQNSFFRLWRCYLRAPDGKVWRLAPDSTAQAHFLWELR